MQLRYFLFILKPIDIKRSMKAQMQKHQITSCQFNKLSLKKSLSCKNLMQTAEHKATPIKNVDDMMASIERRGPLLYLLCKLLNNLI